MDKPTTGWLKIKLHNQSKFSRQYGTVDWTKSVLFLSSGPETRYRFWIQLLPTVVIAECDNTQNSDSFVASVNSSIPLIRITIDDKTTIHYIQFDTRTELDKWLLAIKRTAYSRIGGAIFGQSLVETYQYAKDKSSCIPLIIRQCCEYLIEHGSSVVGLFRVSGKLSTIRDLRDLYDRGLAVEFNETHSLTTISSVLKLYLQSLPEPIIPIEYFYEFFEIGSRLKYNPIKELPFLKSRISETLPPINHATLAYLCSFLKKLSTYADQTKMDTENLAIIFGSNLIRSDENLDINMIKGHNFNLLPLIKLLIDQSDYLFSTNSNDPNQESCDVTNESITKSSGFSSFSSLLSSAEQAAQRKSRSMSLPSIYGKRCSPLDSANASFDSSIGTDEKKSRSKLFIDPTMNEKSSNSTNRSETNEIVVVERKRFASTDLLDPNPDEETGSDRKDSSCEILDQSAKVSGSPRRKRKSTNDRISSCLEFSASLNQAEVCLRKSTKSSLANRLSKPFSSLKLIKPKLSSGISSTRHSVHGSRSNASLPRNSQSKLFSEQKSKDSTKTPEIQIDHLRGLLLEKENEIQGMIRSSNSRYVEYEKELQDMRSQIDQLRNENVRLKNQLKNH